jgi:glutamyl-tRNA reductase
VERPFQVMALLVLGINHNSAPLAWRERVAFGDEAARAALPTLTALPGVSEAALVNTCNRTELVANVEPDQENEVVDWLHAHQNLTAGSLDGFLYRHRDGDAIRHLFRVASGLDSMVLGEPQILGQLKDAWRLAHESGTIGTTLERLFQQSFSVAKRVRTETGIGRHPVSVAYCAVRLAQDAFTDLTQATVMLIGAGETIELALRHLEQAKVGRLMIANRTLANAQALAQRNGAFALPLSEIDRHLHEADIVISATGARQRVLERGQVVAALKARRRKPMFLLDLAVPRDIDPDCATLEDAFLYAVDDLKQIIDRNMDQRRAGAREAETLIELQVEHYLAWWRAQSSAGPLRRLRADGELARTEALEKARAELAAGRSPQETLELLAHTLTNRLLHAPTARLREAAERGDIALLTAAERLFTGSEPAS